MKLKRIVAVALIGFGLFVLYSWVVGFWLPHSPTNPNDAKKAAYNAAEQGLFDQPSPPIIH